MLMLTVVQFSQGFSPLYAKGFKAELFLSSTSSDNDCGCGVASEFSGKPPISAVKDMNLRKVAADIAIYTAAGQLTTLNKILASSNTSLVVFLRSLG